MKKRADVLVVERGLADTRSRAQALILAGAVMRGVDRVVDKPGDLLDEETELWLRSEPLPFVSRGGLKLQAALVDFGVDVTDLVCLDVGASTGGFTDCLLQRGARKVYAVDVGYGQIAWSLRQDPRVVVIERQNIRTMPQALVPEPCQLAVIDVSFISLKIVLPQSLRFLDKGARGVALVKPQFEVGRQDVGKGGIVRDDEARARALAEVSASAKELGLSAVRTMDSPIKGAKGNIEFLLVGVVAS
jgi:23S rRNA (cytidine1920-2'-O)/16S rRNA (cytidine1409-2'-O)-methyltransferase